MFLFGIIIYMNIFESGFNKIKNIKQEVKRAKDELTGNVTPLDYSQDEIKAYEQRKAEVNEKLITEKEQKILNDIPSREELHEMIQADREQKTSKSKDSDYDVAA